MPEIFNEAALASLRTQQRKINDAINEIIDYQKHGGKFTAADKAAQLTTVKAASLAGGVDLGDWVGNPDPEA
jgi:hypothetical protein